MSSSIEASLPTQNNFPMAALALGPTDQGAAEALAEKLNIPLLPSGTLPGACVDYRALLICDRLCISLQQTGPKAPGPVQVSFGSAAMRHRRRGGHNELLGRAVGLSRKPGLAVLDATAGLGRDSFVLADLGCSVSLCERDATVFCLLRAGFDDSLRSADEWLRSVLQRMSLHSCDATELAATELAAIDVIYLDPMFPPRGKQARVKKEMALFHQMLGAGEDSGQLLAWALAQNVARVVVKRPPRAPELSDCKPSHVIEGKAVRYDVYVLRGL